MNANKELKLAYGLAIVLLIVGVLSYAAFPAKIPDTPVRIMFKSAAGKVLFDHKTHTAVEGYGITCAECHHTMEMGETEGAEACGDCHELESDDEDVPKRADAFHQQCIGCHDDFEAGPVDCSQCHIL